MIRTGIANVKQINVRVLSFSIKIIFRHIFVKRIKYYLKKFFFMFELLEFGDRNRVLILIRMCVILIAHSRTTGQLSQKANRVR